MTRKQSDSGGVGSSMLITLSTDIHGNREAFEACLHHARRLRAERFVFLGDYGGYGVGVARSTESLFSDGNWLPLRDRC